MRLTALWLSPQRLAIERVAQCVASGGRFSNVRVSTCSTSASLILRGAPGRGSSSSPSKRRATKRPRHLPTAGLLSRISALTCVFVLPAAQARMTRARKARAWAELGRRAHRSRVSCSWELKINSGIGRPRRIGILLLVIPMHAQCHLFMFLMTQDTSRMALIETAYAREIFRNFVEEKKKEG